MPRDDLVMSDADIQAELGSTEVEVEETADSVDPALESPTDDFSNWEDADDLGQSAEPAAAPQPQTRTFKANGRDVEVNMADQEAVDKLITLGLGARPLFSQLDKVKKELHAAKIAIEGKDRYEKMWKKMDSMQGDHDALYEAVFGRKYEESYNERRDWEKRYEAASPEGREILDERRKLDNDRKQLAREAKAREEAGKEIDGRVELAEKKELRSQLLPEFHANEFSKKVKDPARAEKLNAVLWKTTINNLKALDVELTPELIRKEFRATAALLAGDPAEAKNEIKKVVAEKKEASKEQARVASTRNYSGPSDKDLAKEKDPTKIFRRMFGR